MSEVIDTSKNPSALQLAQREIEQLKKRIRWLESGSIHTCHAECEKPLCVANREIERLRAIVLKIDTKDAMSVQDMYFISGAEQTITTLEAQIKELDEQNTQHKNNYELAYSLCGYKDDLIKVLQLENEQLKTGLGVAGEFIKRNDVLTQALDVAVVTKMQQDLR